MHREAYAKHQEGVQLQQEGRLREASEAYAAALAYDARLELARANLAVVCYQLGEVDAAIFHYKTLLESHPFNVKAHYNLAGIYASIGRHDQAAAGYRQVLTLEPGHALAMSNLAWIFAQQKRYDEAIETYERLLETNPDDNGVRFQLGNMHRLAGDLSRAEQYWRTVVTVDPRHVQALLCMAESHRLRADWRGTLKWAISALAVEPEHPAAQILAARAHMHLLEYQAACEILEALAARHPAMAEVRFQLGVLYHQRAQLEEARHHLAEAVRLDDGRHFDYHNEYAAVLYRLGELRKAALQFRKAEELQPDNAVVKANLGFCYMHMGEREAAGKYFQAFLRRPAADESVKLSVQCALDLL